MDISDVEIDEIASSSSGEEEEASPWKVSVSEYEGSLQDAISTLENEESTKNEGWLKIARYREDWSNATSVGHGIVWRSGWVSSK